MTTLSLAERIALGTLLGLCTALLITPLWLGSMPPLTDFGGHVMLADWWIRLDADPQLSAMLERRDGLIHPNLVLVRFAALCHPLWSATTSIKLFTTLALLAQIGALLALLRTFGRSPWLIFATLPFLWNGMLTLGLLNYVAALPLMTLAVVAATRAARTARWRDVAVLAAVTTAIFPVHALGLILVLPLVVATLWLVGDWRARRRAVLALVPAVTWLAVWMLLTRGGEDGERLRITTLRLDKRFNIFVREGLDVLSSWTDNLVLAVVVIAWILMAWWLHRTARTQSGEAEVTGATPTNGGGRWRRLWRTARRHPLPALTVLAFALVYFLPTYMAGDGMFIGPRLVPLFWWLAMASLPLAGGVLARRWGLLMAGVTLVYGGLVVEAVDRYHRETFDPIVEVLAHVPDEPGALTPRVECRGTFETRRLFRRAPLRHNCPAVVQTRLDAWSGPGFALTPYNAIALRDPQAPARLRPQYIVLFGDPALEGLAPSGPGRMVHRADGGVDGQFWTLYALPRVR